MLLFHSRLVPDDIVHKGTRKRHKRDEKPSILRCTFLHKYLEYRKTIPLHPATIQKWIGIYIFLSPTLTKKCAPTFCQFFGGFGSNPKIYLYLCRALISLLRLGTHPSNIGEELLYYNLYN